jgi:hypothetical protein
MVGVIEIEQGTFSGNPMPSPTPDAYASAGYSVLLDAPGKSVTFSNFPATKQLALRYSTYDLPEGATGTIGLYVQGARQKTIPLPRTPTSRGGTAYAYTDTVVDVNIHAGDTVKLQYDSEIGSALYDCINLSPKLEAENAMLYGCSRVFDQDASNQYRVDIAALGASVAFTTGVQGGSRLAFRYKTGGTFGLMSLYISGQWRAYVFFLPTYDTFADKVVATDIPPNATVTLQFDNGDSPVDLDYIRTY